MVDIKNAINSLFTLMLVFLSSCSNIQLNTINNYEIKSDKQNEINLINGSLLSLNNLNKNIINESNNLTSQSGNLKQYSFNDFNSFKSVAEDLKYEFDDYVSSENTYGLIEAAKIISEETSLYNNLVRVYSSGLLPEVIDNNDELPQYQDDETNYDKIQKPRQLINWLNSLIKSQTSKLESRRVSLDNEVKENQQKFISQKDEYFIALNDLENESEKLDQLLESLNNDLGEDFSTQSFNTKAYDPDSVDKWNKIMEGRQARAAENRQFLRDHFPLLGFLVDQVMDPFTYVPIPGAKAVKTTNVIAKPIFEKFLGSLSKPVWEKIVQRKGYAYATNSYKQLTDSMFQMSKKGKTYEKATETIKKTSDKIGKNCLSYKCRSAAFISKFNVIQNRKIIKDLDRAVEEAGIKGGVKSLKGHPNVAIGNGTINGQTIDIIKGIADPNKNNIPGFANITRIPDNRLDCKHK